MNYADLLEAAPGAGEVLGFYSEDNRGGYVAVGEVAGVDTPDTPVDGDRVMEFAVDKFLHVAGDGTVSPARQYLIDLQPVQHYLIDDPRPAPLPALIYREDAPLGVSLPTPTWRGSRVSWYDTRPEGTPIHFAHGQMVIIQDILPPEVSTSEVDL